MAPFGLSCGRPRLLLAAMAATAALALLGASQGGGLLYPDEYAEIVEMWRASGGENTTIARELAASGWSTVVVPFSAFGSLAGAEMSEDPLSVARRELSKGRYGATLPYFRGGIGCLVVVNDLRLAELEPTKQGLAREREEAGYLDHVRKVTLAAVVAHESTHALQFLRGDIYPGPGALPFPGHDQEDELLAYLNINAIYESQLGMTLPESRYRAIIRQDYSSLPEEAESFPERSRAFIGQRAQVDKKSGTLPPASYPDALARIQSYQQESLR